MSEKQKPGRKPGPPAERRSAVLHVRLRPDELQTLRDIAGRWNVSAWARTALLAAAEEKSGASETAQAIDGNDVSQREPTVP